MAYTEIKAAELLRRYRKKNPNGIRGYYVSPALRGGWKVGRTGSLRSLRSFADQASAVAFARSHAQTERIALLVHDRDGSVAEMTSYGSDPFPSRRRR